MFKFIKRKCLLRKVGKSGTNEYIIKRLVDKHPLKTKIHHVKGVKTFWRLNPNTSLEDALKQELRIIEFFS